ncbi:MAG: hypothetical protein ABFC56_12195 [Clostridiaceae bacterium]
MEQYKKKLKVRILIFSILLLIFVAVLLYNQFGTSSAIKDSLSFSFQCGFSAAGALALVFWIAKYRRALLDELKLRILYNKENDERMKAIWAKSGIPMTVILSMVLVLAGIVIGYFNETVFFVLICVAIFQLFATAAVKFFYMKKM